MTLDEYMKRVLVSKAWDWSAVYGWGAGSGPTFRYKLSHDVEGLSPGTVITFPSGLAASYALSHPPPVFVASHDMTAALKSDLSITIAWGMVANSDFTEEWANKFKNPKATSHHVDFFYNGALVYRDVYVLVDGGRIALPMPNPYGGTEISETSPGEVPKGYAKVVRLLMEMDGRFEHYEEMDAYFNQTGAVLVDTPWPY